MSQKNRQLISEAKLRVRGIAKEIADLKRERCYIEEFIMNSEYVAAIRKSNLSKKWKAKLKAGQRKNKKNSMLKAVMDG